MSEKISRQESEAALDRFERRWLAGSPPDIGGSLAEVADATTGDALLREMTKIDLECRWSRLEQDATKLHGLPVRPFVEDYQRQFPQLGNITADLIAEEYRVRQIWGDRPTHDEYSTRFPELSVDLTSVLKQIDSEVDGQEKHNRAREDGPIQPTVQVSRYRGGVVERFLVRKVYPI